MRIKKAQVNLVEGDLTPMIDMTFQLIAFFMVLINFTEADQDERIKLPSSVLAKPADGPIESPITIHVSSDGSPILAGNVVTLDELRRGLKREKEILGLSNKTPRDANIIIRGDGNAPTGRVQEIIQICQEERFEKFKLRAKERVE
ncbi:MAG: biopolymer transporter ExbD [Planctomycetota bacterium]